MEYRSHVASGKKVAYGANGKHKVSWSENHHYVNGKHKYDLRDSAQNEDSDVSTIFYEAESTLNNDDSSNAKPTDSSLSLKVHIIDNLVSNMFSTISSLKNAYIQLQSAHKPYDPDKIQIADKAVISEFRRLSEIKHSYRERISLLSHEDKTGMAKAYKNVISSLESEIRKKDAIITDLNDTLAQTSQKYEIFDQKVRRLMEERIKAGGNRIDTTTLSPELLEFTVLGASDASMRFARLLISYLRTTQWDLDKAANSIEPGVKYVRSSHKKFAFESFVNRRMLNGFRTSNFLVNSSTDPEVNQTDINAQQCFKEFQELIHANPFDVVSCNPQSPFGKYCLEKFLSVIHPQMEQSFFGNLDLRKQITAGIHPQNQFYRSFLKLAKPMWLLHKLSLSFEPRARIFEAERNSFVSPNYMESIVQMIELDVKAVGTKPKVAFTVMPGFLVGKSLIKCQVYIQGIGDANV